MSRQFAGCFIFRSNNTNLKTRARIDEGVVYTSAPVARSMVREAIFQRLCVDYIDLDREKFRDFTSGKTNPGKADSIIKSLGGYTYLDPAIGKGVFLQALFTETSSWLEAYGITSVPWLNRQVTGLDIDQAIVEYCLKNLSYNPNLITGDFLIEPIGMTPDIIIANPPYVRQELLQPEYKSDILNSARNDWPEIKVSARSDLYIYFILRSARRLAENGAMTFIVPNGWLDSDFGSCVRKLFSQSLQLNTINEESHERHFAAEVNTVIFTATKSQPAAVNNVEIRSGSNSVVIDQGRLSDTKLGWYGSFFRCPTWLRAKVSANDSLGILGEFLSIKTGIITGNNGRYYTSEPGSGQPVVKSPREVSSIVFTQKDVQSGLLADEAPFKIQRAPLLWTDLRGSRHLVVWNRDNLPFEHTFYGLTPRYNLPLASWAFLMNSTWIWLMVEIFGRKSLGRGAIRLVKSDLEKIPIPIPDNIDFSMLSKEFLHRPVRSWNSELEQADRRAVDQAVFKSINMWDYYEKCVSLFKDLINQRLSKSRS